MLRNITFNETLGQWVEQGERINLNDLDKLKRSSDGYYIFIRYY